MEYIDVPTRNFLSSMGYTAEYTAFSPDNVFLLLPDALLTDAGVDAWIDKNLRRGAYMTDFGNRQLLVYKDKHKPILDSTTVALATSKGCEIVAPRACFAVEKPVAVLDATIPVAYDTPAAHIYDDEGAIVGRKTVREVMQYIEGDTKCLILCQEVGERMRHEDVVRFVTYFNADFYTFTTDMKQAWIAGNVTEPQE